MIFEEKITVRLPKTLKRELTKQARARMLQPADLAREALADYLKARLTITTNGGNEKKAAFSTLQLLITLALASVFAGILLQTAGASWLVILAVGGLLLALYLRALAAQSPKPKVQSPKSGGKL